MPNKAPDTEKKVKERKCIVTGVVWPCETLIRFVRNPDNVVVVDLAENLPGRGAWVSENRALIEKAVLTGAFKRAFQGEAKVGADLADRVEARLRARALSALGLARRAGSVLTGFDQVNAVLREKRAALLLSASDAADGGVEKLVRLAREIPVIRAFDVDELSGALGREGIRHVAMKERVETARLKRDILRFHGFRGVSDASEPQNEDRERACG